MRFLSLNELKMATGAGFAEDINTAAATLIVGCGIGAASAGIMSIGVGIPLLVLSPFPGLTSTIVGLSAGLGFMAGPAAVAQGMLNAHPEYKTILNDKFYNYFG